jgi:hypothetical protein
MVFNMIVRTVENMMMKVKVPQKTNRPRNIAERKKVRLIGLSLLRLYKMLVALETVDLVVFIESNAISM